MFFKRAALLSLVVGLIVGSVGGYYGTNLLYNSEVRRFETRIAKLISETSALNKSLNGANELITVLISQVMKLRSDIFRIAPREDLVVTELEKMKDGTYAANIRDHTGANISSISMKVGSHMPGWVPLTISVQQTDDILVKAIAVMVSGEGNISIYPECIDDSFLSRSTSHFYDDAQGSSFCIEYDDEPFRGVAANFTLVLSPNLNQQDFHLEVNVTILNLIRPSVQMAKVSKSFSLRESRGAAVFYVSTDGNDQWSGKLAAPNQDRTDGPFATIERARDAIRALKRNGGIPDGGVTVYLRGGTYIRETTFELTGEDSGTEESPIIYSAYENEEVHILGGKSITDFVPVANQTVLGRIDPKAHGKVLQTDLKAQGITNFGSLARRGFGCPIQPSCLELFFKDEPMRLARWPNLGWTKIAGLPAGQYGGRFNYEGDRPTMWKYTEDVWVHGYWTYDWADSYEKVKMIDTHNHEISTYEPHGVYGYTSGQRYYFLNLLEELDEPGEWYVDRKTGILYFWPPAPLDQGMVFVSILEDPLVSMKNISYVSLRGLIFECSRGSGIVMVGCSHNLIFGCTFRNMGNVAVCIGEGLENVYGDLYRNAVWNRVGGNDNGVVNCSIYHMGEGGIILGGGDRKTLLPGRNFAVNNRIFDYQRTARTYRPAIAINGVGNRVAHNLVYNASHSAIILHGNDHLIEFNEIHHVCLETNDAGAFYMGRDLTERGNVVRFNYFHHLGEADMVQAVYLDDCACGTLVFGNIFCKAGRAVQIGGGRDNIVENNIFIDCEPAVHVDARGLTWAKFWFDGRDKTLMDRLRAVNFDQPPYSIRYPELVNILDDEPAVPKRNKILRNICVGGRWLDLLDGLTDQVVVVRDNLIDTDPGFIAFETGNFQLMDDSPAYKLGFKKIPMEKIGLYKVDTEH